MKDLRLFLYNNFLFTQMVHKRALNISAIVTRVAVSDGQFSRWWSVAILMWCAPRGIVAFCDHKRLSLWCHISPVSTTLFPVFIDSDANLMKTSRSVIHRNQAWRLTSCTCGAVCIQMVDHKAVCLALAIYTAHRTFVRLAGLPRKRATHRASDEIFHDATMMFQNMDIGCCFRGGWLTCISYNTTKSTGSHPG